MPKVKSKQKQKQKQRQSVVVNVNTKSAPKRLSNIKTKPQAPQVYYGGMSFNPTISAPQSSIAELLQILKLSNNQQQELTKDVLLPTPASSLPRSTSIEKVLNPAIHGISAPLRSIEENEKKAVEYSENPIDVSPLQPNSPEDPIDAPLTEENLTPDFVSPLKREEPNTEDEIHYRENPLSPPRVRPRSIQPANISHQRGINEYFNINPTYAKPHTEEEIQSFGAYLTKKEALPEARALPTIAEAKPEPAKASKFYRSAEGKAIVEKTRAQSAPRGRPASDALVEARRDVAKHNYLNSDDPIHTSYPNGKAKPLIQLRRELGTRF